MPTSSNRPDDWQTMQQLTGKHPGQVGLLVLGGLSGENWKGMREKYKPQVIIGVNGVNRAMPDDLTYWMCIESTGTRVKGFHTVGPQWRLVHHAAYSHLTDKSQAVAVNRMGIDSGPALDTFDVRSYGLGFISGDLMRHKVGGPLRVGTVALQCLHLAGILGLRVIHTIGLDLSFKDGIHHWYDYPRYAANQYWGNEMFCHQHGKDTMWFWVETAEYMAKLQPRLAHGDLKWVDHSNGLLQAMGVQ